MGQKVNPIGLRVGISKTWNSKWYAGKDYPEQLKQDLSIQKFVKKRLKHAAISHIEVERTAKKTKVNISLPVLELSSGERVMKSNASSMS